MKILLTNDDSIHSRGIIELDYALKDAGHDVFVVAPQTEQSGISSGITFLKPLHPVELPTDPNNGHRMSGFSLDGTPADCAKLALVELCDTKPDLVVSGINGGLNAGVNVGYSGTVGAALMASALGYSAIALSLEYGKQMDFVSAAKISVPIIERLSNVEWPAKVVMNVNIPTAAIGNPAPTVIVPVETNPLGYTFDQGIDPKGRPYYWANNRPDPIPSTHETDCAALKAGKVTISPISYDLNTVAATEMLNRIEWQSSEPARKA